jgi:hypothetical protein
MKISEMMDNLMSYTDIAKALGMTRSNVIKLCQQEKMRRGKTLGHLNPEEIRHRYLNQSELINTIAKDAGCSVIQMRRYLQAHNIFRDRGQIYRANTREKHNKGIRISESKRDLNSRKAKFGSLEHREKMAKAKRGKIGENANHWKGGIWKPGGSGYEMTRSGGKRNYRHRVIAENLLRRELIANEEVHHVDMNRKNNNPSNLIVIESKNHLSLHRAMKKNQALDQRAWLKENRIKHEDLNNYA